jgi:hypothetical protein
MRLRIGSSYTLPMMMAPRSCAVEPPRNLIRGTLCLTHLEELLNSRVEGQHTANCSTLVRLRNFQAEGDGGLEGAKLACRAVARFIAVRHENPELAAPFLAIMQSFTDLERGLEPPLFSTKPRPRERERSSQRKHLQMLAAVALEVLAEFRAAP